MSRKPIETNDTMDKLRSLVPNYYDAKQRMGELKASTDVDNAEIKQCMTELGTDSIVLDGLKVTVSTQDRESFNEDKLLSAVSGMLFGDSDEEAVGVLKYKDAEAVGVLKYKPYVDMDVLESLIYAGKVSTEQILVLDKCKEHKYVTTLRVTKVKKKEEE